MDAINYKSYMSILYFLQYSCSSARFRELIYVDTGRNGGDSDFSVCCFLMA